MNWMWLISLVSFGVLETLALLNKRDKFEPATYWIRRLLMLRSRWQPLYWLAAGLWVWLGVHFFIDS
jgi:hypothetical protein